MRPVLPSGCGTTSTFCGSVGTVDAVTLSGYGVELALKNMEYKAMDDTAIKKSNSSTCFLCTRQHIGFCLVLSENEKSIWN